MGDVAVDCDDGNPCTDDACSDGQCTQSANSNACDDGRACTEEDRCLAGVCSGFPIDCNDANACTVDACDDGECLHEFAPENGCCTEDADCDSGDPCLVGQCLQGACAQVEVPGCCTTDGECDDGDPCTTGSCLPPNLAALKLDGFTYVTGHPQGRWIHEEPFLNSDRFTLELWFRWHGGGTPVMTGTPEDGVSAYPLISKGRQRDAPWLDLPERQMNYFLGIDEQTGVLVADFEEHEFGSNPGRNHPVRGTTPLTVFRWYHAAVTYDGACWQLYLNGQPETDGADCPSEPATWNSVAFAAVGSTVTWDGAMAGLFVGMVDEVRIWRRALGLDEIADNHTRQIPSAPGLMARWGFDGTPGLLVPDTSGLEHHAIIVGIPAWERETLVALDGAECRVSINGPNRVSRLVMTRTPTAYLDWSVLAGSPRYDLASGPLSALRADRVATEARCIRQALTLPGVFDTRPDPASGDGYYYLVQARNDCGPSGFGFDTDGFPRAVPDCPPDGENKTSAVTKSRASGTSPAF